MSHTGLWDAELAWYSLSITCWICLYGLEYCLLIHDLRPNLAWSLKILLPEQHFLNYLATILLSILPSHNKCIWMFLWSYSPVQTHEAYVPEFDNVLDLSLQLSNHALSKTIHNITIHQYTNYTVSTFHGSNCFGHMYYELTPTKILQNFWFTLLIN